jgi:fructokinase
MGSGLTIVGLGEALWDVLPGGKVLGGAPLNVACHVHRLLGKRGHGVVASRVGIDALGDEVLQSLASRGMTTDYVQRDARHATSTVNVALEEGQPTYVFAPDIAWDHLEFTPDWAKLAARCDAVCYGTLAQRSPHSRAAIWKFLDAAPQAVRLFDVNLRQGFYDREAIVESCRRATMVKLNEHELPLVADWLDLSADGVDAQLAAMQRSLDLASVVYTRGKRGTLLVTADGAFDVPAATYPPAPNADAVGAGDACTAGIVVGWLTGATAARTAELANELGAYVASQPGATPELPVAITASID